MRLRNSSPRAALGALLCFGALALYPLAGQAAVPEGGLDSRGWEMVSPVQKNGGDAQAPDSEGGAALQAALAGGGFAYGSTASFGAAAGAPPTSQYLGSRAALGWDVANLSPPLFSGTYEGGAYQLFSTDLSRAVLSSGWECRDGASACPAQNTPLGTGAPAGYRNLYLRQGGDYQPLITSANSPALFVSATDFHLALAGASPDLAQIVISTCAALTASATEVPSGSGCEEGATNLYKWSAGSLAPLNFLPAQAQSAPGATLAAPSGAISADGSRIYWRGADGNLYLRQGAATLQVDVAQGGGGAFQAASADGALAFFTKAGHLYRYDASSEVATDLTPTGEVQGVLGISPGGSYAYYLTPSGLFAWHSGTTAKVAATAEASSYPPATSTARVSANGNLAFLSSVSLTGFPNAGKAEAYLYDASAKSLTCASCNPTKANPLGPAAIPAARAAGFGPAAYRPRALSANGTRLFFDTVDKLIATDTNKASDVYQWEAQGTGSCVKAGGCIGLVSSGRTASATFLDASADGTDVFFLTAASLLSADIGGRDVYDARAGGGFPEPPLVNPCQGDECQGPPSAPDDPVPGTAVFEGPANPAVHYPKVRKRHHHRKHKAHQNKRNQGGKGGKRK